MPFLARFRFLSGRYLRAIFASHVCTDLWVEYHERIETQTLQATVAERASARCGLAEKTAMRADVLAWKYRPNSRS